MCHLSPPRTANTHQRASNEQALLDGMEQMLCNWAAEIVRDEICEARRVTRPAPAGVGV
jgi:hypothetical protein